MKSEDDTLVVTLDDEEVSRIPFDELDAVYYFGYKSIRPTLMNACAEHGVKISVFHPDGQFMSNITSYASEDDFLLLRRQYTIAENHTEAGILIARHIVGAKIFNSRWFLGRIHHLYKDYIDLDIISKKQKILHELVNEALATREVAPLYALSKRASAETYSVFNDLILFEKNFFTFKGRSTKQPVDPVNALLTFAYRLIREKCEAAVLAAGLDPYVGFFNEESPERKSLVFDIMEEFKACIADRFVITLINEEKIGKDDFVKDDFDSYSIAKNSIPAILDYWHEFNSDTVIHTFIEEDIEWGNLPYTSAILLSQFIRNKIDKYPPFFRQDPPKKGMQLKRR